MIVSVNEKNQNNYIDLFTRAYNALVAADKMEANTNGRLTSLGEYYAHMLDLIDIDKNYAMVPLDEEPFVIDANSRTIKVPADFSKCTSVQSDHYAEMIVFSIDRYFDYTDLGAETEIWAQWTAPAEKGVAPQPKASVCVKDETGATDKLRFGWIIGPEVTKVPGTVKFSIRIFRRDAEGKIVYSFNTLTSELTIKPVLEPALVEEPNVDDPINDNTFKAAIINSMFAPDGGVLPIVPDFGAPGLNFKENEIFGLVGDTLTLEAQAVVPDTGVINYSWHYSEDGDTWVNCADESFGTIGEGYKKIIPDGADGVTYTKRILKEFYYEKAGEVYTPYTGVFPVSDKELYEKVSTYTVAEEGKVTGYYKTGATNTVGHNTTQTVYSNTCVLPEPQPVAYTIDLNDNATLKDGKYTLTVETAEDKGNPTMSYTWKFSNVSAAAADADEGTVGEASHAVTAPGWYKVNTVALLNRETQNKDSKVCRVTEPVAPLTLSRVATTTWPNANENSVTIREADRDTEYELKVAINETLPNLLISDEYNYIWEIQEENTSEFNVVTENTPNYQSGLGTDTLKVKYSDGYQNYRCKVVNTLNNQTAISTGIQFVLYGAPAEE